MKSRLISPALTGLSCEASDSNVLPWVVATYRELTFVCAQMHRERKVGVAPVWARRGLWLLVPPAWPRRQVSAGRQQRA